MMDPMNPRELDDLQSQREHLRASLAAVGDLRPGSLVQRRHRCGKPTCHCAHKDSPGHGPSWILTRAVNGRTVTKGIPVGPAVQQTRQQIEEYQRFRALVRQFIEVSERLCDAQLRVSRAASTGAAQKGGFQKRSNSKARSSRKSKPS